MHTGGGTANPFAHQVGEIAEHQRPLIFAAALSLIEAPPAPGEQADLCRSLLLSPGFFSYIFEPDSFDLPTLLSLFGVLSDVDAYVDVKVARFLSGRADAPGAANTRAVLRALEVLDDVFPGGRLIMSLNRLLRHPDPAVVSKAALVLGRRVGSPAWVEHRMASSDARVRANVVQALWGINEPFARAQFRLSLADPSSRVVGNALVGLHRLGDPEAAPRILAMSRHPGARFRATAAWVMGELHLPEFAPALQEALADEDSRVRHAAEHALRQFRAEPA
jgi:HEAT repeat protein